MPKRIGIIGRTFPLFMEYLSQNGYEAVALIDQEHPLEFGETVKESYTLPLQNKTALLANPVIYSLHLDGLVSFFENYIQAKAWLTHGLGLPGISESAAQKATDKQLMRAAFTEHCPEFSPAFAEVKSHDDVMAFLAKYPGPVVIKPANLVKSLLVTLCMTQEEAVAGYHEVASKIADVYRENGIRNREPKIIIEEYLVGPYFSVDAVSDRHGNITTFPVVDLIMGKDRGFEDHHNYSRKLPSTRSQDITIALEKAAAAGLDALGLLNSAAHCELVLTQAGPKLIEIGARFGGYRPLMYQSAYGVDLFQAEIDLALGVSHEISRQFKNHIAVYEVFPESSGVVQEIRGRESVEKLKSLKKMNVRTPPGSSAGLAKEGYRYSVSVILETENEKPFQNDCKTVEENLKVITK